MMARRASTSRSSTRVAPGTSTSSSRRSSAREARLADGTYGLSVVSGKPIPDGRLEVQPTAERTVDEEEAG